MPALGLGSDPVKRSSSLVIHLLPAVGGELADAAEVPLVIVVELLGEPHVGSVNHESIGRTRDVFLVATAAVSGAAGSSVAAEKDVHGGTVLDDLVEIRVGFRGCRVDTVVRTLGCRTYADASARGSNRRGGLRSHTGCVVSGERDSCVRREWDGGNGRRDGAGRGGGGDKGLVWLGMKYGIRNVAGEVIMSGSAGLQQSITYTIS